MLSVNITAASRTLRPHRFAADAHGGIYVAGTVLMASSIFIESFTSDIFVMKLDSSGRVLYTTYIGGDGSDTLGDMAVDAAGYVYITGDTQSSDFPIVNALQRDKEGNSDGFVCQLGPTGGFVYSTYIGGDSFEFVRGIAIDAAGNAYITGGTESANFPLTAGAFQATPLQPNVFGGLLAPSLRK